MSDAEDEEHRQDGTSTPEVEDMKKAKEMFDLIDDDGDGRLSRDEFRIFFQGLGFNPTEAEMDIFLEEADSDDSGFIEWNEYQVYIGRHLARLPEEKEKLRQALMVYDTNGDGTISVDELREILKRDDNINQEDVEEQLQIANEDRRIEFNEIIAIIMGCDREEAGHQHDPNH